ncbi:MULTISPECIES: hypothetical protein [unclassified Desulfovibrio]|uniref:hypothetical protein n=1 Tax=unclassified Desulfovibrio TaxID=2593640 RepID=UPI0013EC3900|nr:MULTISPECIES: hypothetical protein [unclassified Desulfovibrio]
MRATETQATQAPQAAAWLTRYFLILAGLGLFGLLVLAPYAAWWLHASGDAAVERAVAAQGSGRFALFGSGVSQDFVDYKLRLYAAIKPDIAAVGSSRVMQFRGAWFRKPFCNMGGVAGNLAVLRSTVDAMLRIHKPGAVILGLDFWWFLPQWEAEPFKEVPPTSGSYNYGFSSLKKPWQWLLEGKISPRELAAPLLGLFGAGFREDRFGIMAQQTDDGFGPDGSWYATAEATGQKLPLDFQFRDTLAQVAQGSKAFYRARPGQDGPSEAHLDAFAEIWCRLRSRGVKTFVFIAPLSPRVLEAMRKTPGAWPHLFRLREALASRGIDALDCTDAAGFASGDCEFIDGFHGGEVSYARILRRMADRWPALLPYVDMEKLDAVISGWAGHVIVPDSRLTPLPETDFMRLGCPKRTPGDVPPGSEAGAPRKDRP